MVDVGALNAFNAELFELLEKDSIPNVAETHRKEIIRLTAEGKDAFKDPFHPYNKEYAKRLEIPRRPKTLRRTGKMLDSLALEGDTLTVRDADQEVALGQMTGHDGDWGYEHLFLTSSAETDKLAGENLTEHIIEAIHG